jgi:hypothetical protein
LISSPSFVKSAERIEGATITIDNHRMVWFRAL